MSDAKIAALEERVNNLATKLEENTKLTREVLDTLRAFKMIGSIAKWGTLVGGAVVGAYHGFIALFQRGG